MRINGQKSKSQEMEVCDTKQGSSTRVQGHCTYIKGQQILDEGSKILTPLTEQGWNITFYSISSLLSPIALKEM